MWKIACVCVLVVCESVRTCSSHPYRSMFEWFSVLFIDDIDAYMNRLNGLFRLPYLQGVLKNYMG